MSIKRIMADRWRLSVAEFFLLCVMREDEPRSYEEMMGMSGVDKRTLERFEKTDQKYFKRCFYHDKHILGSNPKRVGFKRTRAGTKAVKHIIALLSTNI